MTDAAEKLRKEYTSKIPENLFSELDVYLNNAVAKEWVKNAPPDGWSTSRTLELSNIRLREALEKIAVRENGSNWGHMARAALQQENREGK